MDAHFAANYLGESLRDYLSLTYFLISIYRPLLALSTAQSIAVSLDKRL